MLFFLLILGLLSVSQRAGAESDAVSAQVTSSTRLEHYIKIPSSGTQLPASADSWSCVLDSNTELMREVNSDEGGIHGKQNTYRWDVEAWIQMS